MLSALVGNDADGIDIEAEICRLMGFDPAMYTLVKELAEASRGRASENVISKRF